MSKKTTIFIVMVISIVMMFPGNIFAQENDNFEEAQNYITINSFRDFLEDKIENNDSNSVNAEELLIEFEKLSPNKKEKFISYINDPSLISETLNSLLEDEGYASFKNGDVIVSSNVEYKNSQDSLIERGSLQSRIATGSRSVSILGLKVFEYSGELRYTHNGSSIKSIEHANIWISRNFIPFHTFTWSDSSTYGVGSNTAHHIKYCTWSLVHNSLGLTYGSHQIEIKGNIYNNTIFTVS